MCMRHMATPVCAPSYMPNEKLQTTLGFACALTGRLVCDNFRVALRFTPVAPHPGRYAA